MTSTLPIDSPQVQQLQAEVAALRRDLARCRQREAAALQAAQHDPLTGLANRRVLDQQVRGRLQRPAAGHHTPLALLFVDLDGFKLVNDRYGHEAGDAVLKVVALRLQHTLRQDDLACRIGGDEFVCVLFGVHAGDELQAIEDKLMAAVCQPCQLGALTVSVRPSIGSALFPRDGRSVATLLAHADRAMYRRKAMGGLFAGAQTPGASPLRTGLTPLALRGAA